MDELLHIADTSENAFQEGILGFNELLCAFSDALEAHPRLRAAVFDGCDEWRRLLQHKLVPQLSGDGCLVVAVAGGTNTGKSTIFNLLLGERRSAACSTAAATCAPVLATSVFRHESALHGSMLPEFAAVALDAPEDATRYEMPEETLWVTASSVLPDSLALLDTPDVDSIEKRNWSVADHIRAAGDVIVAVLTPEKYKDARVVDFFRQAHASGRLVVPVMNKANPNENFAAPRAQLAEFIRDAALENATCFALSFDYDVEHTMRHEIHALDEDISLADYLRGLDVAAIKRSVYRDTLEYVLFESAQFLERIGALHQRLAAIAPSYRKRAYTLASVYNPQPGEEMGKLLHDQIRAQRSRVVRGIARVNDTALRGLQPMATFVKKRVLGMPVVHKMSDAERMALLREHQQHHIERIANDFASVLLESVRDMEPVVGGLMRAGVDELDIGMAVDRTVASVLGDSMELSDAFKEHVMRTISNWWRENPAQRRFLIELDALMVFAPTAIAMPVAVFSAGIGAPELLALAGPMAGEFMARIMENKFADQWVGLLQPWQQEQRDQLAESLHDCLTTPALSAVSDAEAIFEQGYIEKLRSYWELCQTGFQES